jgi:serine O-acetyltransferase
MIPGPIGTFLGSIRADHNELLRNDRRYAGGQLAVGHVASRARIVVDAVTKVGFQLMVAIRLMRMVRDLRVPFAAQFVSRLIRHLYSADVHWDAEFAPGVAIVHGIGLVVSHSAVVGPGCLLFQGVTLGQSIGGAERTVGAPRLGRDVHLGVGATLLGPIEVGDGSKVGPGVVLDYSLPPGSRVRSPKPEVVQ